MKRGPGAADGVGVLGTWLGGYRLLERLGSGGHGEVFLARAASHWAAPVAVKVLGSPTAARRARLAQEAAVLATIDHPHVVPFVDLIDDDETTALVMGYARGGSLADWLTVEAGATGGTGRALTVGAAVDLALRLSEALQEVHDAGLIHGDVKAANVLFTSGGHPMLGDFGVAGWAGDDWSVAPQASGWFSSPEHAAGRNADRSSDVYGLAACVVAALGGSPQVRGPHRLPAQCVEDLPLSSALARVLRTAVAIDPQERFPTARSFGAALAAAGRGPVRRPRS